MKLISHGWVKRCEVCERHSHAKWHEHARGEINPVALIEFVEAQAKHGGTRAEACDVIVGYICAVTGMDVPAMRKSLEEQ